MTDYIKFYEDEIKLDIPRIVSIQTNLTNVCPQHCVMCHKPEWAKIQKGRDGQLDAVHTARELNEMPLLETVVLSGGDPMNYKHLQEYLSLIRSDIQFGMFTTGLDNAINRYRDLPLDRFGYIRFSIDGFRAETWAHIRGSVVRAYDIAWQNVVDTLARMKEIFGEEEGKKHVRVQYTIQSENIAEFADMLFKCYKADVPLYGYWVHDYNVVSEQQVKELQEQLRYGWDGSNIDWIEKWTNIYDIMEHGDKVPKELDASDCVIPLVHAFIDTDGKVFPCCYLVGDNLPFDQRDVKYSYGNIYDTPLIEILSKENMASVRRQHINNQNEICKACSTNKSRYYKVNLEAHEIKTRRPTFL